MNNETAALVRSTALANARDRFDAFNAEAPAILRVEWDAAWDAMTADELYDLRDEFSEMLEGLVK